MAQAAAGAAVVYVPCSVSALASAMTSASSGETLSLAARCRYTLTEGLPVVSHDLTILGHDATLERSYARGTGAFTILTADAGSLTIRMLNFRNGNGAISMGHDGALTVDGGIFTRNTAADGGAIYDRTIDGPEVNGAAFIANTATDSGGAICICGEDGGEVQGSAFIGNKAAHAGGGIYVDNINGPHVSASTFSWNTAEEGGALFLNPAVSGSGLSHIVVRDNKATSDGGGIFNFGSLDIAGSEISGNHGGSAGGGLFSGGLTAMSVRDTGFQGNSARDGGGIYSGPLGSIDFTGSTISGNFAGAYGGGVYNQSYMSAAYTGIVGNTAATAGGGIYDDGSPATATLTNSPVLVNKPDNCEPPGSITGCAG